jgi:tetratricopeptide (TPR) repeat protein
MDVLRQSGKRAAAPGSGEQASEEVSAACLLNRQGLALEAAQRFAEAEQVYRAALNVDSRYPDTCLNLAALISRRADRCEESFALCRQALQIQPNWANAYILLGCLHQSRFEWDQAEACHRKALATAPDLTEAHQNLGLILAARERHSEAVSHFRKALTRRPDCPRTWNDLGISLRACGLLREAVGAYCSAIECKPDFAVAWFHKGNVLQDLKYYDQAGDAYRRAVELDSRLPDAWNNLGVVLRAQHLEKEALKAFRKAAEQNSASPEIYNNMGLSLAALERFEESIDCYQTAIQLNPLFAEAYRNLGDSLREICRMEDAITAYRKAVQIRPDFAAALWNLSLVLLQSGHLHEGFSLYHYRRRPELGIVTYPHTLPAPRWDGSPCHDKTLLVYCEQGLGDSIQFSRYLRQVRQRGGRVILETQPALVRLFETSQAADEVISSGSDKPSVHFDLCTSVMDLPELFGTTLQTIPNESPYLFADPQDVQRWHKRIGRHGYKAGIVWAGNPEHENDQRRSINAEMFAHLKDVSPDIRFFSLQIGDAAKAAEKLIGTIGMEHLGDEIVDLADTAAAIMCLDLVICVDTSVAHLTGALGRPVWTLLPYCSDWRWLLGRDDSPWYPGMRLFRQRQRGNWSEVFGELRQELKHACLSGRVRKLL